MQRYAARPKKTEGGQHLVAVEVVDPVALQAEVVVVLGRGRRVEVGKGFDAKTLQQVVAALEGY
jgi:hypothetical protein